MMVYVLQTVIGIFKLIKNNQFDFIWINVSLKKNPKT